MGKDLVEYYYDKIVYYCKINGKSEIYTKRKNEICDLIKKVIDNNIDYIFKEAFLDYLSQSNIMIILLFSLADNEHSRIGSLSEYFRQIEIQYEKNIDERESYINLLDDDTKRATIKAHNIILDLQKSFQRYHYRIHDVYMIVYIVLTYCYMHNKINEFDNIIKYFVDNPYKTLDDLYINNIISRQGMNIYDNNNALYDRIFNLIDAISKPKIK